MRRIQSTAHDWSPSRPSDDTSENTLSPPNAKTPPEGGVFVSQEAILAYNVDSISKPQASSSASGIYFEFLFRRAHSRKRVDRIYWSGLSLNSFTICSKEVTVGTTGPMGSGLPQFGFPRRFAIEYVSLERGDFRLHPQGPVGVACHF